MTDERFHEVDSYHYPVDQFQVSDLVRMVLTHVEAMNLPDRVEKANKNLLRRALWDWWNRAVDNSLTSTGRCIGPIRELDGTYEWLTNVGKISNDKPHCVHTFEFDD